MVLLHQSVSLVNDSTELEFCTQRVGSCNLLQTPSATVYHSCARKIILNSYIPSFHGTTHFTGLARASSLSTMAGNEETVE